MADTQLEARKLPPFPSRALVIAAVNLMKAFGHDGFEALRLELDLTKSDAGEGGSLQQRANSLAKYVLDNPDLRTPDGVPLQSELVARAGEIFGNGNRNNLTVQEREAFRKASETAGTSNNVLLQDKNDILSDPVYGRSPFQTARSPDEMRAPLKAPQPAKVTAPSKKVFIVHGRDEAAESKVARFIEKIGLEAIILREQLNKGQTVIEKFETNSDVGFAVVLLTPDDSGGLRGADPRPRARQNVILEWGFFIGRLGRSRVVALKSGEVELPSDILGIVWHDLDAANGWQLELASELAGAGLPVNQAAIFKRT